MSARHAAVEEAGRTLAAAPSPPARPFLKWAGGKSRLLSQYAPLLPEAIGDYHEPFLGSGAVFFSLRPRLAGRILLSDRIEELVFAYRTVRDDAEGVIRRLKAHVYDRAHYGRVRAQNPRRLSPAGRAARFIYLNRTGFNGLYRVNRRGEFNVPFGRYKNPRICDAEGIRAAGAALAGAEIETLGFERLPERTAPGDFVYLDPPYHPRSATANFTAYTASPFGKEEQAALAEVCRRLDARGVRFMLSNSEAPFIRDLYDGFRIDRVFASRAINSRPNGRGKIPEIVVRNYGG